MPRIELSKESIAELENLVGKEWFLECFSRDKPEKEHSRILTFWATITKFSSVTVDYHMPGQRKSVLEFRGITDVERTYPNIDFWIDTHSSQAGWWSSSWLYRLMDKPVAFSSEFLSGYQAFLEKNPEMKEYLRVLKCFEDARVAHRLTP
ncbi:MAG: hypothetical protein KBD25_03475 [Rickettsiaceae bacterium]|nr:hypothetical protein [Rickettsiaceae bacterium]